MDDSRAALNKAYSAVRERYNKLRLQHRQLLRDRTCLQCRQKLNPSAKIENFPGKQTTFVASQRSASDASEIHDICCQLKQMVEAGQVADNCCIVETIIPQLQNVASHLATNASFDEQQESLLHDSVREVSQSFDASSSHHLGASVTDSCSNDDFLQSQKLEIDATVMGTTGDFKTCEMYGDSDYLDKNLTAGRSVTYLHLCNYDELEHSEYC